MTRYEILPVFDSDLPEVSRFLEGWHQREQEKLGLAMAPGAHDGSLLKQLQWRLVQNPARRPKDALGGYLRVNGKIGGVLLFFPSEFVWGQKKLTGLCSSNFFVESAARVQGFFLFRQYLGVQGYDFWFGTTCNRNSGALWKRLGGAGIAHSAYEYVIPIRLEAFARSFATPRHWHAFAVGAAAAAGSIATRFLAIQRRRYHPLWIEECRDWHHLANLAERHRDSERLTCGRSARHLEWRYGKCPAATQKEVYVFRDGEGSEGWFAIDTTLRGRTRQLRTVRLLDVVGAARAAMAERVVAEVVRLAAPRADMVLYEGGPQMLAGLRVNWLIRRRSQEARSFLKCAGNDSVSLAERADFVLADGDSAD